ncbi:MULTISPECIES: hypothetical protein [unclassified Streptomyces]|uniref:hypothetical protein n=1 Tax=unclassified Streptomyces TaxID=2593676 RepID=UPI002DD9EDC2|nr:MULTISPECIES: hypothetical protein [unclassified Streptomyces]WSS46836.1 hypothetical protein OG220_40465 [Streptomyces sp. NBC_01187]WSA97647.1 hypothetical protein OIE63_39755 [Streptomyces sp. NBC_01795]WSA97802.1 hypothetical protein OIE63_40030 [Streptomyces sp. NBC_01795]WSB82103.1 hypothetical protein OHB04_41060 [Streptomyces sp. NBC_01775]WSB82218.1 hypothetical protein OHB04_40780 [Streptomyces sp. NBC_01775]
MRKTARRAAGLLVATAAAVSVMSVTAPGAQAYDWNCNGKKVSRCITKSGGKFTVKFRNNTNKKVKGSFGITCAGSKGQKLYTVRTNLAANSGYIPALRTCPKGYRYSAVGWQVSADTYYTPYIRF